MTSQHTSYITICSGTYLPCRGRRGVLPVGATEHGASQDGQTGSPPTQIETRTQLKPETPKNCINVRKTLNTHNDQQQQQQ